MKLRTTTEYSCQAWTVALFSALICLGGLTQVAVCVWLLIYTTDFVPVVGDPMRNAFIGYIILGSVAFLSSALGVCSALLRNKAGLIIYCCFLVGSMVCQAGLWVFIYFEQREVTMPEGLQKRIMKNSDTAGLILNEKFHCRLEPHSNDMEELVLCGDMITEWVVTVSRVLWGLSAVLICIQFLTLVMVTMLWQLVREVLHRDRVVNFYDAEVTNHPRQQQRLARRVNQESENSIYDHLGHIQCNPNCHADTEQGERAADAEHRERAADTKQGERSADVHQTTINL